MTSSARVRKHREKTAQGMRRIEVIVPATAANDLRAVAKALRQGGAAAEAVRNAVNLEIERPHETARAFFERIMVHIPPGEPLVYERDQSTEMRDFNL
jgi:hypothetical protein